MISLCCTASSVLQESFDVPDQVDSVVIESSGQQTSSVTTIKSESQISQALSISAGISVDTAKAGFSSSASYAEMQVRGQMLYTHIISPCNFLKIIMCILEIFGMKELVHIQKNILRLRFTVKDYFV